MRTRKMHRVKRQRMFADDAATADDHLKLIDFVKVRPDHTMRSALSEKRHRMIHHAFGRRYKTGAPSRAAAVGDFTCCFTGFDVFIRCDLGHVKLLLSGPCDAHILLASGLRCEVSRISMQLVHILISLLLVGIFAARLIAFAHDGQGLITTKSSPCATKFLKSWSSETIRNPPASAKAPR